MKFRIISIIPIVLVSAACRNTEIKTVLPETVRVRVTGISTQAVSIPIHTNGMLVSSEEVKLSFKTGGVVAKINIKEGDRVKKGTILASLNLSEVNANAKQAESGYEKALRDFQRAENLYRDSVATLEQKQNAATALGVAKATLDIVQFNLSHSTIIAPDNGVILKQFVKTNELVSSGFPVFLFGSSGIYWKVKVSLSDKDIIKVTQGDSAEVTFDAYPGIKFPGTVDQIGEMSNPFTGTYDVELLLDRVANRLASGFVAGADLFPSAKEFYCMVPVGSIVEADGHQGYIYVLNSDTTVRKVKVEIRSLIGSMAAIKDIPGGITEVVSEGAAYLKDGLKVDAENRNEN